jgi:catechol 2,3-dioxygenase-like lactoylglutathione lyase family enzyme
MKFEVVVIPVSDIDRAKEFYTAIEDVVEQEYLMKIPTTLGPVIFDSDIACLRTVV